MAKVTYDPTAEQVTVDALPDETNLWGYDFKKGKAVEVENPALVRKFSGHPHFKVVGKVDYSAPARTAAERESAALGQGSREVVTGEPAPTRPVVPDQGQPETPAKVTPGQADKPDGDSDLRAAHRGRGVYAIMQGDKDEEILSGLTKEEAEDFNNLDAKAKAKFLKDHQ